MAPADRRPQVVLVDDDEGVRFTLGEVLGEADVDVLSFADAESALGAITARDDVDLVITDLRMPGMDGMQLLEKLRALRPGLSVVMITAHGSEAAAVKAMKLGAYDYFKKPFEIDEVLAVVQRATERVRLDMENRRLRAELSLARWMVFRSAAMSRVAQLVERAAPRDVTVLITGESGTGKELVAEALVAASGRADAPFIRFNCAALPRELAEAELFGHTSSAFTGARSARAGLFREAHGGTLLLDEVGELDLAVQGKLLRVLQTGEVRPVGEDRARHVDVRLVAATHRDLPALVKEERFREDLYYRLNVVEVRLPPLRERPEDIEPLIEFFVRRYAERFGLDPAPRASAALRARLAARDYPGNVRELENVVERLVALCDGCDLDERDLDGTGGGNDGDALAAALGLKQRVEAFERGLVLEALRRAGGNRSEAARALSIGRATLIDKLHKYGIE
ncbi:MAG: sigma-54-dependent Fis family transcriptional regulator [Myxococcales bacterium]|nr:sigma-54-dependent Fis family transcriptional regulator [Myxococcales bacterium]